MSRFFVSVFLIHLLVALCAAQEVLHRVKLDNGDVVTGVVLSEEGGVIHLEVDYLGVITIPTDRVSELTEVESMILVTREIEEPEAKSEENTKEEKPSPVGETEVEVVSKEEGSEGQEKITEVVVVKAPEPEKGILRGLLKNIQNSADAWSPLPEWEKRLQFGINSNTGRKNQTTVNYRYDMQRKFEASRLNFNAEYSYGDANDVVTLNKLLTKLRWRKDISPGVFYESQTLYSWDEIKFIDSNVEQKLGLGTRFFESDASTVSAAVGATGRWREFSYEDNEVIYLVDLSQDWDYKMTDRISVKQDFKFAIPLEDSDGYELNFSAALTSDVTESINLSVRYELGFDNSLAEPLKEDRRFISSLGYSF